MTGKSSTIRTLARMAAIFSALASLALAQMGGGMMGGGMGMGNNGIGSGGIYGMSYGMMGGNMFGMGSGMSDTFGPTVGPDGTAYVLRWTNGSGQGMGMGFAQGHAQTQLVAVNPANGTPRWTLPLSGSLASQPALGTDGSIFLTIASSTFSGMFGANVTDNAGASLLVVSPAGTVTKTVSLDGDLTSAPKIASDGSGGYLVYVIVSDFNAIMFNFQASSTGGKSYLYAFWPNGELKFKLQLS